MNPDIKAQWTTALREHQAGQTQGVLGRVDGKRCCLGVLCDLAVEANIISPPTIEDSYSGPNSPLRYGTHEEGSIGTLPEEVMQWAGIDMMLGTTVYVLVNDGLGANGEGMDITQSLASLNDSEMSFPQIADVIDRFIE